MQFTCNDGVGRRSSATRSRSASLARWCLCSAPPLAYSANEHSLPTMIAPARPGKINGNATGATRHNCANLTATGRRHRRRRRPAPQPQSGGASRRERPSCRPAVTPLAAPVATGAVKRQQRLSAPPTPKQRPLRSIVRIGRFGESPRQASLRSPDVGTSGNYLRVPTGTRGVGPPLRRWSRNGLSTSHTPSSADSTGSRRTR